MSEVGYKEEQMDNEDWPQHGDPETAFVSSEDINRRRQSTSMRITPRTYDGRGNTSWSEYKSHFERVSRINNWCVEQKLDYLWVHLTDAALSYVETLSPEHTETYAGLCEALEERFGDAQLAEVFKSELRSRRRRNEESLPALAQDINRLVKRAYPDMDYRAVEELAVERFREALTDPEQRMAVFRSKSRTLNQAVQAAIDSESWQISESRRASTQRIRSMHLENMGAEQTTTTEHNTGENRHKNPLESLQAEIQKIKEMLTAINKQSSGKQEIRCYYCNKPGHLIKNCRKRIQDEAKDSQQGNEIEQS